MTFIKNLQTSEHGLSGEVFFGLFEKDVTLLVEGHDLSYAQACAINLNEMSDVLVQDLCEASIRYRAACLEANGVPAVQLETVQDILKSIDPRILIVPCIEGLSDPVIHLELNCAWEEEHGMEWMIRDRKVLYVGAFSGEDPLGDLSTLNAENYAR
ncbi:MAG: hypothetical protein VXW65_06695 [Pseudomonadota bacterium]|nr:hypothetical protein [Pseudomonadota bacterium]